MTAMDFRNDNYREGVLASNGDINRWTYPERGLLKAESSLDPIWVSPLARWPYP